MRKPAILQVPSSKERRLTAALGALSGLLGDLGSVDVTLGTRCLGGLLLLLLGLGLGDGGLAGSGTDLGLSGTLGHDGSKVGTDDTTLNLDVLPGALLGDLLCDALLVHATVNLGPGDLAGVLALEEEGLGLGSGEAEGLKLVMFTDVGLVLV